MQLNFIKNAKREPTLVHWDAVKNLMMQKNLSIHKNRCSKSQPGDELLQPNQVEIFGTEPQTAKHLLMMDPMSRNI